MLQCVGIAGHGLSKVSGTVLEGGDGEYRAEVTVLGCVRICVCVCVCVCVGEAVMVHVLCAWCEPRFGL